MNTDMTQRRQQFLPRDAILAWYMRRPSVCPSVRLSLSIITQTTQHHSLGSLVFDDKDLAKFQWGHTHGGTRYRWCTVGKNRLSLTNYLWPISRSLRLVKPVVQPGLYNPVVQPGLFNTVVKPVVKPGCRTGLTTVLNEQSVRSTRWSTVVKPVVKPVWQPVWQPVGCLFTRYSRLSNRLYNRFDNRLYRVNGVLDAAYCYRRSSVVCLFVGLSVCHDHEPCKNCWTDGDAVWALTGVGPRNYVWSPHGKGQFWGRRRGPL